MFFIRNLVLEANFQVFLISIDLGHRVHGAKFYLYDYIHALLLSFTQMDLGC